MTNVAKLETNQALTTQAPAPQKKLLQQLADKYGVAPDVFRRTVAAVAMPHPHTDEELISCLIVANEHDLNPLTKELHFMRAKTGQIIPIVGVDGWVKKLNSHPKFNGFEFIHEMDGKNLVSVTCKVHMKGRDYPVVATELMAECIRLPGQGKGPNAWSMTPSRMLRHRALMQAARYAVGFSGVMDLDEFERWQAEMKDITPKTAVLAVPTDIDDGTAPEPTTEAEANQDGPLPNPEKYLSHLETQLKEAEGRDEIIEVWAAHQELEGRLSEADRATAESIHAEQLKRFEPQEAQLDLAPPADKKKGKK